MFNIEHHTRSRLHSNAPFKPHPHSSGTQRAPTPTHPRAHAHIKTFKNMLTSQPICAIINISNEERKRKMEETKERLKILKEIREDRRKILERLEGTDTNDIRVVILLNELTYIEREIIQLSWELSKKEE